MYGAGFGTGTVATAIDRPDLEPAMGVVMLVAARAVVSMRTLCQNGVSQ